MTERSLKYYSDCQIIRMIETDSETLSIDVFEATGVPADLSGADAYFHLMEFSTRNHIFSKQCYPVYDPDGGAANVNYPYTVPVHLTNSDTLNLEGHYIGQLELVDMHKTSKYPFQIEIVIVKKAG